MEGSSVIHNRNWHWRAAEESLAEAEEALTGSKDERYHLAVAQVHATLAAASQEPMVDPIFVCDD